jgi:hypothetical protein
VESLPCCGSTVGIARMSRHEVCEQSVFGKHGTSGHLVTPSATGNTLNFLAMAEGTISRRSADTRGGMTRV